VTIPKRMTISVEPGRELRCSGEIDQTCVAELHQALEGLADGGGRIVLDLTRVTYISSVGIAELFEHAGANPLIVRVQTGSAVNKIVRLCGLGSVAKIEEIPRRGP
jgi:anti-anti-sigma factor